MQACADNIGDAGRRMRMRFGAAMLGTGIIVAAFLLVQGIAWQWRLWVFLPFLLGGTGIFQARART